MTADTKEDLKNGIAEIEPVKENEIESVKKDDLHSEEAQDEKIPYPKSVFFIVSNECCERFSYYGMRTILSFYLAQVLLYSESDATIIYHLFTVFCYFFPIFGAIISDSYLGRFNTILYVSMIYAAGSVLLALTAAKPIGLPQRPFSILALFLVAFGTGGIKPCVSSFGGDQFVLPQQEKEIDTFFSVFYFCINAGSLVSTFLTPVLREDVECFGETSCYPLAFAVPGVLMIVSIVIFAVGKPMYKIKKPKSNIIVEVSKCIWYGAKKKFTSQKKAEHWLDHAEPKFGKKFIDDLKITLNVLVIFLPLPIYYTLYDQQGSGWTFQANRMSGDLGFYTLLPDQMQIINPLLILVLIPIFTYGIYPFFAKFGLLKGSLQRMAVGIFLTSASFVISAGVSFVLESTFPVLPSAGNSQIRIYNPLSCNAQIDVDQYLQKNIQLDSMGYYYESVNVDGNHSDVGYEIKDCEDFKNSTGNTFEISEEVGFAYYLSENGLIKIIDDISKPEDGFPMIRTLIANPDESVNLTYKDGSKVALEVPSHNYSLFSIEPGRYKFGKTELEFKLGGVYTVLGRLNNMELEEVKTHVVTEPNSVNILWLIPQYFVITVGEILFSITGLEFSYSEAPVSMKSVMTASFLMADAIGNLVIVIIESIQIFQKKSYDFLLYAGLMILDLLVFIYIAVKYKYADRESLNSQSGANEQNDNKLISDDNNDKY